MQVIFNKRLKNYNFVIDKATRVCYYKSNKREVRKMTAIHKPYDKFKGWLRENNLTYKDVANVLNISVATVSAKINGNSDFLLAEIQHLKKN